VTTEPVSGTVTIDNTAGTATYTPLLSSAGAQSFQLVANDGVATSSVVTVDVSVTGNDYAPVVGGLVELVNDDFQSGVTGPWTNTSTTTAPADASRGFLGQFANQTVSLPLSGIPSHTEVTISFDLYVLNSWDGNGGAGPDRVTIAADGVALLDTTFSNVTDGTDNSQQSYPAGYLGAYYASRTWAAEANTLGGTFYGDSVYNFTYTFAHSASTLQFDFSASGLEDVANESWGLDNVVVTTQHLNIEEDIVSAFALPGSDLGGEALTYTVTTPPTNGTVTVAGAIATYTPTTYYNGTDTLGYTVSDATTTTSESTISILIDPLDSAPILDAITDVTVDEDSGTATVTLTGISPAGLGDEDAQTVTIQATSFTPTSIPSPTVVQSGTTATLTYTPVADATGAVQILVGVTDDGQSGASGGVSGGFHQNTGSETFTINLTALNDAPSFDAIADVTMDEDATASPITITSVVTGGGSDEATQTVTFTATSSDASLVPDPTFSGSGDTRTLTFAPAAETSGTVTITVTATDDGADDGTTEFGSATDTFTITVNPINDTPSFDTIATETIDEDSTLDITLTGVATGGGSDEAAQVLTFTATSSDTATLPNPTITGTGTTRTLSLAPVADENGAATVTVTVTDDGGTADPLDVDAYSQTFIVVVSAVNDAPLFDDVTAVSVDEDAGLSTVSVTGVDAGGGTDESSSQSVLFAATSSDATIVPDPSVSTSGTTATVVYTPVASASGTVTITLTATDTGSGTSPNVNTLTKTFDITVNTINDAPSFDTVADQTVDEDTASVDVSITTVSVGGGGDESSTQSVTFSATSSDATIVPDPTVTGSGDTRTLTYAPVADATGVVTVTLVGDDGGPTQGASDVATATQTFTITVDAINDAPTIDTIADFTIDEDAALTSISLTEVGPGGGADEVDQIVSLSSASLNPTVISSATFTASEVGYDLGITPVADANGVVTILVNALDDGSSISPNVNQDQRTFTVTVTAVDDAPSFDTISDVTASEDSAPVSVLITSVSVGPTDEAAQTLSLVAVSSDVTVIPDPTITGSGDTWTLTFQPVAAANGSVTVSVTATDDGSSVSPNANTYTQDFVITVAAVNDTSAADDGTAATDEDVAVSVPLTGSDADGDLLSFLLWDGQVGTVADVSSLYGGTVAISDADGTDNLATAVYTPAADFNGTDTFQFIVNDGTADSATATVTVTVAAQPDAPVAEASTATTPEDAAVSFSVGGSDADGDAVTVLLWDGASGVSTDISSVNGGTVSIGATTADFATVTYTPPADYAGDDTFEFVVNDGLSDSASATVVVTIDAINDAPTIDAIADQTAFEDDPSASLTLTGITDGGGTDEIGQAVTVSAETSDASVVDAPSVAVSEAGYLLTYAPVADATGTATITVTVQDDGGAFSPDVDTITTSFVITVSAVNDAPSFDAVAPQTVVEDATATSITVTGVATGGGADEASQVVSLVATSDDPTVVADPTVTESGGIYTLSFQPEADANGVAIITITATDDGGGASPDVDAYSDTFIITVDAENDAPTFDTVADETALDDAGTVSLGITGVSAGGGADEVGQVITFVATSSDPTVVADPTVTESAGVYTLTYDVTLLAIGSTTITLGATDDGGSTGIAQTTSTTFLITVESSNAVPVSDATTATTDEDVSIDISLTASDGDADGLTFSLWDGAATSTLTTALGGTVTLTDADTTDATAVATYVPAADANGSDTFEFLVNDGTADSATATVTITVNAVNDDPTFDVVSDQTVTEDAADTTLTLTNLGAGGGEDESTQTVTVVAVSDDATIVGDPTVSGSAPSLTLTYAPIAQANGSAAITVTATDDAGGFYAQVFTITVEAVSDAPTADDVVVTTSEDTSLDMTLSGADDDGDSLTFLLHDGASTIGGALATTGGGSVTLSGTVATYVPPADYSGVDFFNYVANDGSQDSGIATATITVDAVNDAPVVDTPTDVTVDEDAGDFTVSITGAGVGGGADESAEQSISLSATSDTPSVVGDPTVSGSGSSWTLSFSPEFDAAGDALITVTVDDGGDSTSPSVSSTSTSFLVTVSGVNDAPWFDEVTTVTLAEDDFSTDVTVTGVATGGGDDEATQILTFTATSSDTSILPDPLVTGSGTTRTITLSPAADAVGAVTVSLTVVDDGGITNGGEDSFAQDFYVVVSATNDLPVADALAVTTDEDTAATATLTATDADGDVLTFSLYDGSAEAATLTTTNGGSVTLTVDTPAETLLDQWATSVVDASSEYSSSSWGAVQALGEPDTLTYGDFGTAWSASSSNGSVEYIAVAYDTAVYADGALVSESWGAGGVFQIDVIDTFGGYSTVWSGVDTSAGGALANFAVTWGRTDYLVSGLRVWVDADADLSAAEEIDAIQLSGSADTPGQAAVTATYTPAAQFSGVDTFQFVVSDGEGSSDPATVTVTVGSTNDAPSFDAIADVTVDEDSGAYIVSVTGINPGGGDDEADQTVTITVDAADATVVDAPSVSQVDVTADITITPAADASGSVVVTVTATDSGDATSPSVNTYSQDFTVTVNGVNDAPVASQPTSADAVEGGTVDITLGATDVDTEAVTFYLWDGASYVDTLTTTASGSVTLTDADATDNTATATYAPPTGFDGSDTFEFVAYDGAEHSAAVTVTVVVGSLPRLSIADVTVAEGADGSTVTADFTVTMTEASESDVTVDYGTAADTAVAGEDYTAAYGTLTFSSGELSQVVSITVHGDDVYEAGDTFYVDLSAASGAVVDDAQAVATITNDDSLPTLAIEDVAVAEGGVATLTVTMSNASDSAVTVDYATADGLAFAASDYTADSGTLTIPAGDLTATLDVAVGADTLNEDDETFTVTLSAAAEADLAQDTAVVTITDDDDVVISVADVSVIEDDASVSSAAFVLTLSGESEQDITVDYATSDGEAGAGEDYTKTSGALTLAAGETTATVDVPLLSDDINEDTETFGLTLSNVVARGVTLGNDLATASIVDDDSLSISAVDAEVTEGDDADVTLVFPVSLSRASGSAVTVDYTVTADGESPADLTTDIGATTSGTLSFAAGETTADIVVDVTADTTNEADETITVTLANPTGPSVSLANSTLTGTILDNDDVVATLAAASGAEADGTLDVTVTLSGASEQIVTVDYATADGTAVVDEDYTAASGTVTLAAGETTATVSVSLVDDAVHELDETFSLSLSGATGRGVTADNTAVDATITNDDPVPSLSVDDVTGYEGDGSFIFVVSLAGATSADVTVGYATANIDANAGDDYDSVSGTLTIAAGVTSVDITVPVTDDADPESDESFTLSLRNATDATVSDGQAVGTILDDDEPPTIAILTPADGGSYASGTASVDVAIETAHHAGTWRWKVATAFDTADPTDGTLVESGTTATIDGLIDGQAYRVYVALADETGALLDAFVGADSLFGIGRDVHTEAREFVYDLPAGPSLFSLTLEPLFLTNGTDTYNVSAAAGGPLASHVVSLGASVVTQAVNGEFSAAIGRDGAIAFGSDFSLEPGLAYIVNMPEATSFTLEGLPLGASVANTLLTAPALQPDGVAPWMFAVGVELSADTTVPTDVRLNVQNLRTGETAEAADLGAGRYGVTFISDERDGVAREGDELSLELVTREGYRLDARRLRRVTQADGAYASAIVTMDARPRTTQLLANYPNPFNPETWIPFTLTSASEATVRIYDIGGALVRTLDLGHRAAGHHVARADAAHWDGKNAVGEPVSSGQYFYELAVGDERSMRQMVIRK
jgi:hypothetical protein